MTRDRLSKREDRALHQALASVVLTQFPNPQRKDCPETSVLRGIAKKNIPMHDPAHDHVGSCSPCFSELTELREALHRRNLIWATGTAGTALLALAVLIAYFAFYGVDGAFRQEAVKSGAPTQTDDSIRSEPSSRSDYVIATLDLRNASTTRTAQPSASTSHIQPREIPRANLALTVQLPIGSEAGPYGVQIVKPNEQAGYTASGQARIENGITTLVIHIDTTSLQRGEYIFKWRLREFGWTSYPILIP